MTMQTLDEMNLKEALGIVKQVAHGLKNLVTAYPRPRTLRENKLLGAIDYKISDLYMVMFKLEDILMRWDE